MRLFNTFYCVLNRLLLCSSLMYCDIFVQSMCMCNECIVYINLCMFIYKLNVDCIVYMNSVSVLCVSKSHPPHVCIERAKLSRSSLRSIYEQPNKHIIHNQTNNSCNYIWLPECLFVWLHHTVYARRLGVAKECSYI